MSGQRGAAVERVLAALREHGSRVEWRGSSGMAHCPAESHDDRQASLSIGQGDVGAIVCCQAGCDTGNDVLPALGLTWADLFDAPRLVRDRAPSRKVAEYTYTSRDGEVLFAKVRYQPKGFSVKRPDGRGGWLKGIGDAERVLYRLPAVQAAVRDHQTVFLVEGEKDADRLASMGYAATCNFDGAAKEGQRAKWRPAYGDALTGADVVIIADRDDAGIAHAFAAARDLETKAKSVVVVHGAVTSKHADVSDHLDAGYGIDDLVPLPPECSDTAGNASAETHAGGSDADQTPMYEVEDGCLTWNKPTKDGPVPTRLATFDAKIAEEVTIDDGTEQSISWLIEVRAADGRKGAVSITPDQLANPKTWATKAAGVSALVMPGMAIADHVRVAVQSRSRAVVRRTIYAHTGWRYLDGRHAYLTSTGALSADRLDESVTVDLGPLSGYALPDPTAATDATALREAVRASLSILDLAAGDITTAILAAAYRAPLPLAPDCSVWVHGHSGTLKTAITALSQQHFGAAMDAQNLPGNWTSTANALEAQAYTLDGALFTVDDYSPDTCKVDAQRRAGTADRLLRGSANRSGRGRLRPDGTMRSPKPPRAQVLTSAEDLPPSIESLRARVMVVEFTPGAVALAKLASLQDAAADGVLALAMAGYVQHLAARYDSDPSLPEKLAAKRTDYRDHVEAAGHPRYALNIATLALGWHEWLAYAESTAAISGQGRADYWARVWAALSQLGADQDRYRSDADPVHVYLRSLAALVASGRMHMAGPQGLPPDNPEQWGWAWDDSGEGAYRARSDLLGWVDGDDVFLQHDVAFTAARQYAESGGRPLGIGQASLQAKLRDRGMLASKGSGHLTVLRTLGGQRNRRVLHLTSATFLNGGEFIDDAVA
jgi:hypothetical protein